MPINLDSFKINYKKWVEESLPDYRAGKMQEIIKKYPLVVSDDIPWTSYRGRPSKQTIALVTSGGLYLKHSQPAFDTESIHGDPSFREIPKTVRQEDIGIAHAHYDHSLALQDINIIFPVHRFAELEKEGIIGRVPDTLYSFSYVNDVVTLVTKTLPDFIARIKAAAVDVMLLVPV
ncbi:MAG: glycine/sarcosine/betaine reductase selenoprotein B family protein [Desulfobacterales bacterium]|jgi:glycine/betaine/sarcosine/D-proline reductase family selenoprotein B